MLVDGDAVWPDQRISSFPLAVLGESVFGHRWTSDSQVYRNSTEAGKCERFSPRRLSRWQLPVATGDIEVSKPYYEMTPSERLADRIAKNRRLEQGLRSGKAGLSLDGIIDRLDARKQRATYGAVAELVGVLPRGLMSGRPNSLRDSWVVAGKTRPNSRRGWPTGYTKKQIHPDCYRQIRDGVRNIIDTGEALKEWIADTT
jgi:hypothetical protein